MSTQTSRCFTRAPCNAKFRRPFGHPPIFPHCLSPIFTCYGTLNNQGNGAGTAIVAFMFLFSGFFIPYNDIPPGWRWFSALSMFKYPLEGMVVNMLDEEIRRGGLDQVRSKTAHRSESRRGLSELPVMTKNERICFPSDDQSTSYN